MGNRISEVFLVGIIIIPYLSVRCLRKIKVSVINEIHFNISMVAYSFTLHSFCLILIKYFLNNLQVGFQVSRNKHTIYKHKIHF